MKHLAELVPFGLRSALEATTMRRGDALLGLGYSPEQVVAMFLGAALTVLDTGESPHEAIDRMILAAERSAVIARSQQLGEWNAPVAFPAEGRRLGL